MGEAKPYTFYLLRSGSGRQTYTGISNRPERRIRCHRGEIKGGAKWPMSWKTGCEFVLQVHGFQTRGIAQSFECRTKRRYRTPKLGFSQWLRELQARTGRRFPGSGVVFRTLTILHLLTLEKWQKMDLELEWFDKRYAPLEDLVGGKFSPTKNKEDQSEEKEKSGECCQPEESMKAVDLRSAK